MEGEGAVLEITEFAYGVCAALIAIYAWNRFNTPASNRSSTLQMMFWSSCLGYVFSALMLFVALSFLLQAPVWQNFFGLTGNKSLPAPLIATLAMTTLLPTLPILKRVDAWLLETFHEWGAIPSEARRRAATMTPASFSLTAKDIAQLHQSFEDDYGRHFTDHLREEGASGLKRSEYRFTRVAKLYDRIRQLATEPRYRRFFSETGDEFAALERQIEGFLRRAVDSLDDAVRLDSVEGDARYQELMAEWHDRFGDDCRQHFILLVRFLARATLRSEPGEAEIVARLRQVGFTTIEPNDTPKFPLNSLTVLGLGIFGYLVVTTIWFSFRSDSPPAVGLTAAGKLTVARLGSIAMTVWLLQQFACFRREPGEQPRYFAYLVNGVLGGALAAGIWVLFRLGGDFQFSIEEMRVGILSGILCAAIAFCCDDWSEDGAPPVWLRLVESIACGSAMAAGTALIYFLGWTPPMPKISEQLGLAMWITLPSAMAMMIGACVPHIYREARRAAAARRISAMRPLATAPQNPGATLSPGAAERLLDKAA
jgi:hypothetical protein